ncbi:MAG: LysE family transporter [Verrucomicrobiota bacterium]|nr:LysE family transporter [Verrucomicrobiota bacterium]
MLSTFFRGAILGLGLVVPLGPQNTFIFQRATIQQNFLPLFPVLFVFILCDAALILGAVLGVECVDSLFCWKKGLMAAGGTFLLYFAWTMWKSSGSLEENPNAQTLNMARQVLYAFSVSLLNPHAILDAFFAIGTVSVKYTGVEKYSFALGCITMDIIWFVFLAIAGFYLKKIKNGKKIIQITNKTSSIIMIVIAIDLFHKILSE